MNNYVNINSWDELIKIESKKEYMIKLMQFISNEELKTQVLPKKEERFTMFDLTPLSCVKVVIIGQDPYHGLNQAHGLAFSVKVDKTPPSLKNIFKELKSDLNIETPQSNDLSLWAKRGVLLINRVLTVSINKPLSHKNKGWETFTDEVIKLLNAQPRPICFILWGNEAKGLKRLITNERHLIITSAHPSPLSAYNGFFGSKPFSKTNDFLINNNISIIDWNLN